MTEIRDKIGTGQDLGLSPEAIQELLKILADFQQPSPALPQAGSPELDRQLAAVQSGFMPTQDGGAAIPLQSYYPRPQKPEFSKQDWFGTLLALGVIAIGSLSAVAIVAALIAQMGKSAEGESYRRSIEQLVKENKELSTQAIKAAQETSPDCYGLFVASCGSDRPTPVQSQVQLIEPPVERVQPAPALQVPTAILVCDTAAMQTQTPVNIRAGGGVEFPVLTQVPCGGIVHVFDRSGAWASVSANDVVGYMKSDFLGGLDRGL